MAVKHSYKNIGKNLLVVLLFSILNILCCEISEDLSSRYREISYWYLPAGMFYAVFVTLGFRYIAHLFIAVIIGSYFCVKILGCSQIYPGVDASCVRQYVDLSVVFVVVFLSNKICARSIPFKCIRCFLIMVINFIIISAVLAIWGVRYDSYLFDKLDMYMLSFVSVLNGLVVLVPFSIFVHVLIKKPKRKICDFSHSCKFCLCGARIGMKISSPCSWLVILFWFVVIAGIMYADAQDDYAEWKDSLKFIIWIPFLYRAYLGCWQSLVLLFTLSIPFGIYGSISVDNSVADLVNDQLYYIMMYLVSLGFSMMGRDSSKDNAISCK